MEVNAFSLAQELFRFQSLVKLAGEHRCFTMFHLILRAPEATRNAMPHRTSSFSKPGAVSMSRYPHRRAARTAWTPCVTRVTRLARGLPWVRNKCKHHVSFASFCHSWEDSLQITPFLYTLFLDKSPRTQISSNHPNPSHHFKASLCFTASA